MRPGATRNELGFGWSPDVLVRLLDSWKRFGPLRHLDMMDGEQVAAAAGAAVTAAPGVSMDIVQVNPERSVSRE